MTDAERKTLDDVMGFLAVEEAQAEADVWATPQEQDPFLRKRDRLFEICRLMREVNAMRMAHSVKGIVG